jgi:hypothetical protein
MIWGIKYFFGILGLMWESRGAVRKMGATEIGEALFVFIFVFFVIAFLGLLILATLSRSISIIKISKLLYTSHT